jgi:outer membrane receptor protein involved in Fe transport
LITRDDSRVDAFGYTGQASKLWSGRHALLFGGELFHERIYSRREETNPLTGAIRSPRPLFPDDSRYRTWGLFAQNVFDWSRFRATLGGRLTGINYQTPAAFGLPASSLDFRDLTFHASGLYRAASWLGLHARVGRGFRAPNANDLGALGLNDLGFEIPASEAVPAGALLATTAGENALSSGKALRSLQPERLFNYEVGVQVNVRRVQARAQVFNNELYDPIVRRTLLFPAASPPSSLAGLPVTPIPPTPQQREQGVVTVATALDPRAVKAFVNDGRARYYGVESLTRVQMSSRWSAEANYTFLVGRELNPNRNVRRLPPQQGTVRLRYQPARRWWAEAGITAAGAQERLSGGDLDDERIGAARSRRDIEQFFLGTRISPAISGGVFRPTGETLRQIQDRVLPLGAVINGVRVTSDTVRVPLYTRTAGWATVDFRGGFQVSESFSVNAALLNLLDKNYRFHGAGVDAPGINAYMGLLWRF